MSGREVSGHRSPDLAETGARRIITLDGPASSGKSTTAREVARVLGFRHLNSGTIYRALTFALLDDGAAPERWNELRAEDFDALPLRIEPTLKGFRTILGQRLLEKELRSPLVTGEASRLAALAPVRAWLLRVQREAGRDGRLVADGRDMGTVVFPEAELKFYLTAHLSERARRRLLDHGVQAPTAAEIQEEARCIADRDRYDSERQHAPLRCPDDAYQIDTTSLTVEEQVTAIVAKVLGTTGQFRADSGRGRPTQRGVPGALSP